MGSIITKSAKLVKMDGRHSHSNLFRYIIKFNCINGYQHYHNALKLCYDNWGVSIDVETYSRLLHDSQRHGYEFAFSPEWSYLNDYGDHRIYLTDAAASWGRLSGQFGV